MYLSRLSISGFRRFGLAEDSTSLDLELGPGLNLLVGENDSGKTAIVDAIRLALGTTSYEYARVTLDDFHVRKDGPVASLSIKCEFADLSADEQAQLLEHLSHKAGGPPVLQITFEAHRAPGGTRIIRSLKTGTAGTGILADEDREYLAVTYLRPLRDAQAALTGGRSSRLAQILKAHANFVNEGVDDFKPAGGPSPQQLVGIFREAEHRIQQNAAVKKTQDTLNTDYLSNLSVGDQALSAAMTVGRQSDLRHVLEKLELGLIAKDRAIPSALRGLGLQNVLFMAAELLLLGAPGEPSVPFLVIEEPEAHLHPQMQLQAMEFLRTKSAPEANPRVQTLMTSHSPVLASTMPLDAMTIISEGRPYPLRPVCTKLEPSDYAFLARFLDATRANLFFARGVLIVEGDGEQLLLPTIAELLGRPFAKHGVSIVNVGSRGLFRYARILQRASGPELPIRVACLADRDLVPKAASGYVTTGQYADDMTPEAIAAHEVTITANDGPPVKTFVSPAWTLEHDLALHGLARHVHVAVSLAKASRNRGGMLNPAQLAKVTTEAEAHFDTSLGGLSPAEIAAAVYEPLKKHLASKAETAQFLAERLRAANPPAADLRKLLPAYLVEACDYVTRADATPA